MGMLCSNGVVVAADTQESYPSGEKSFTGKIFPLTGPDYKAIVAGAGQGHLIDYAKDKIFSIFRTGVSTPQEFETQLARLMQGFYENEFRTYPVSRPEEKHVELLVAVKIENGVPLLFSVDATLVGQVHDVRILSAEIFSGMARDFQKMRLNIHQAVWACMYVIKEAKERYEGIGGTTQVMAIEESGQLWIERTWDVAQREQALGRLDFIARRLLIGMIPATGDAMLTATIRSAADLLRVTRRELQQMDREYERMAILNEKINERSKKRLDRASQKMKAQQSALGMSKPET
jgi:hypothetical protein